MPFSKRSIQSLVSSRSIRLPFLISLGLMAKFCPRVQMSWLARVVTTGAHDYWRSGREGTISALFQCNLSSTDEMAGYLSDVFFSGATVDQLTSLVDKNNPLSHGISNDWYPGLKRLTAILGDMVFTLARRMSSQNSILKDDFRDDSARWISDNLNTLRAQLQRPAESPAIFGCYPPLRNLGGAQWDHRAAMADRKAAAMTEGKANMKDEGARTAKDKDDIMAAGNNQHKSPKKRRKVNHGMLLSIYHICCFTARQFG
ncbi:unnamed protein product [Clonostachys solani]|uniref:Uncharacterized protein n=1 Tax=Clonostachys solani TaxID=160281 RepID=A0A9N9ZQ33_9HYPO|nr:unnamed protein product [Clonostachys solani]